MKEPDETRPDIRVNVNDALSDDELAAEAAADLPDREALSLVDPGTLLGGSSLPGSSPTGTSPASGAAPSSGAPSQPIALPGSLGSLSDKIIGTGGTSNG